MTGHKGKQFTGRDNAPPFSSWLWLDQLHARHPRKASQDLIGGIKKQDRNAEYKNRFNSFLHVQSLHIGLDLRFSPQTCQRSQGRGLCLPAPVRWLYGLVLWTVRRPTASPAFVPGKHIPGVSCYSTVASTRLRRIAHTTHTTRCRLFVCVPSFQGRKAPLQRHPFVRALVDCENPRLALPLARQAIQHENRLLGVPQQEGYSVAGWFGSLIPASRAGRKGSVCRVSHSDSGGMIS